MKHAHLHILGAALVAALTPVTCSAESTVGANEQATTDELKAQEDPTILKRRIWSDTEWSEYNDGSHDVLETVGKLWSWRVTDSQEWGVRLKIPFKFHTAGNAHEDSDSQGLEDIKLAAGTAFRLSESWRTAAGVELRFPSAADDLGDNVWRLQLFGAVAWDVTQQMTLSPSFELNKSVAEQGTAAPQHFLEMFFPVTFLLPQRWSVTPRLEAKVDFENGDHWTRSAKFAITKQLEQLPLGLTLSIKKPFDGSNKQFQLNFITTYYFR